jgi:hypothetical protein
MSTRQLVIRAIINLILVAVLAFLWKALIPAWAITAFCVAAIPLCFHRKGTLLMGMVLPALIVVGVLLHLQRR